VVGDCAAPPPARRRPVENSPRPVGYEIAIVQAAAWIFEPACRPHWSAVARDIVEARLGNIGDDDPDQHEFGSCAAT
jgi:hypothetical protein